MQYILNLLGAQSLVGIDASLLTGAEPGVGRVSMLTRELSQSGQPGENDHIRGDLLQLLIPVLFPERALVVVRNIPDQGTQTLVFLHRNKTTVLHSMPQNDMHRLIELETPMDEMNALNDLFPISGYMVSPVNALIPFKKLEKFKEYAESDQEQSALKELESIQIPLEDKKQLFQAFSGTILSGSFALLTIGGNTVTSAESLAVIADEKTAWSFSRPDKNSRQNNYRLRRTGDDLPIIIRHMFDWLENGWLP